MKRIKRIRKFLKKNEVFFTTLTAVSLTCISILIAIQGNKNSERQTKIAERQQEIEYFTNLPTFQIEQNWYWNIDSTQISTIDLDILKLEGNAKNIFVSTLTILTVEFRLPNRVDYKDYIFIPDFFHSILHTGHLTDKICTVKGVSNNFQILRYTADNLRETIREDLAEYAIIEQETYIKISYTNFLNEPTTNYYRLDVAGASIIYSNDMTLYIKRLFNERGRKIDRNEIYLSDFKKLNYKEMYNKIKTTANKL
jgi:hypothetical protein